MSDPLILLRKVSDHFPVCLDLRPAVHQSVAKNIEARIGVVVKDKRFPDCDFAQLTSNFKAPRFHSFNVNCTDKKALYNTQALLNVKVEDVHIL